MPAFTYYYDTECMELTGEREVDEALLDVRHLTGEDYRIHQWTTFDRRRVWCFWQNTERKCYAIICRVGLPGPGISEFQVLNLGGATISHVGAFLFGVINGYERGMNRAAAALADSGGV